jgi:Domain of unknown function (DUF5753)
MPGTSWPRRCSARTSVVPSSAIQVRCPCLSPCAVSRDILPNPYEVYIGLEAGAASIRNFEPIVVPGLLQTEEYARKTLRNGPGELDREDVERLVQVRMERQRILGREDRPRLWAVLDEAVIRRLVGGPEVMREQLRHLIDCAEQGKTTLQVVPFGAGAHAGTTGPFVILEFPEPTDPDVVYVETLAGDIYLEASPDVDRYALAFARLLAAAPSCAVSKLADTLGAFKSQCRRAGGA